MNACEACLFFCKIKEDALRFSYSTKNKQFFYIETGISIFVPNMVKMPKTPKIAFLKKPKQQQIRKIETKKHDRVNISLSLKSAMLFQTS